MAGIAWWNDEGISYIRDFAFVGYQYDFKRDSKWKSDDSPGWGASDVQGWSKIIAGNSFNFPSVHGKYFEQLKVSYISSSRSAFELGIYNASDYRMLDIIFGEQRSVRNFRSEKQDGSFPVFSHSMQVSIEKFVDNQITILVSGAYIGTDILSNKNDLEFEKKKSCY